MATVIRIIKYEGTEEALQKAIAQSLPLGQKLCNGYTITVAEHQNDLPPLLTLEEQRVADLFRGIAPPREMEADQDQLGPFGQYLEKMRSSPIPADVMHLANCCCPPKGHKGAWAAGPCPIHQGIRRSL